MDVKATLRQELAARRTTLGAEERSRQSKEIMRRLAGVPPARAARTIAGYHPFASEVDPTDYLREACALGRRVALPRIEGPELRFHEWAPWDPMERGPNGIQQPLETAPIVAPDALTAILVPGVGFDLTGHRLGFGKGYYDRFLGRLPAERRIGVAFDLQVVERLPREEHDVPMGWLVTPTRLLHFV